MGFESKELIMSYSVWLTEISNRAFFQIKLAYLSSICWEYEAPFQPKTYVYWGQSYQDLRKTAKKIMSIFNDLTWSWLKSNRRVYTLTEASFWYEEFPDFFVSSISVLKKLWEIPSFKKNNQKTWKLSLENWLA